MTIYGLNRLTTAIFQSTKTHRRPLFYWLVIVFNRVDEDRIKQVGPDRACAEWLLKNGGYVRWKGFSELLTNYNAIPANGTYYIEAVEANNAGICDVGFSYFEGCKHIKEMKLESCRYIDNKAMANLSFLKDSLINLEIINCKSVDDNGLRKLKKLKNLRMLKIKGLPAVMDNHSVYKELAEALPNCKIDK